MQSRSLWMRFFLLFALILAAVAAPVDRSTALAAREDCPPAATSDVPAPTDDDANLELEPTQEEKDDPEFLDADSLFKRKGGKIGGGGKTGGGLLGSLLGGDRPSSPPPRPATPPPAPPAAPPAAPKSPVTKPDDNKPATPPPAKPDENKPATPPPAGPATPATPATPAKPAKPAGNKNPNKGKKPALPQPTVSNSKKNKLKDQDVLFFSGTGGAEGTKKAKDFAKKHNLKVIDDGFTPGTISNVNQFDGDKAAKDKFLRDASQSFAQAIPGNTKGKVFVTFPGDKPPANGIFNTVELPALKANGHSSLTKLDFDNLDNIDPKTATDSFAL